MYSIWRELKGWGLLFLWIVGIIVLVLLTPLFSLVGRFKRRNRRASEQEEDQQVQTSPSTSEPVEEDECKPLTFWSMVCLEWQIRFIMAAVGLVVVLIGVAVGMLLAAI